MSVFMQLFAICLIDGSEGWFLRDAMMIAVKGLAFLSYGCLGESDAILVGRDEYRR
jgi:hypothetical protein